MLEDKICDRYRIWRVAQPLALGSVGATLRLGRARGF